jgi:hypothetical protein
MKPFNSVVPETTMPSAQGEYDLTVTAVAATATRFRKPSLRVGQGHFAKVQ